MSASLTFLTKELKAARLRQGLSQQALAKRVGIPQSHISKIESGAVDLQSSSLIELARALDLEVVLVRRELVPATTELERRQDAVLGHSLKVPATALAGFSDVQKLVTEVARSFPGVTEIERLAEGVKDIAWVRFAPSQLAEIGRLTEQLMSPLRSIHELGKKGARMSKKAQVDLARLSEAASGMATLRNLIVHGVAQSESLAVPAYRLEESDDA